MAFLDFVGVISTLAAVVAVPFSLVAWSNMLARPRAERAIPVKSALGFVVPVIIALLCGGISTYVGQYRFGEFLDSVSPHCTVSIDGQAVANAAEVLDALRHVADLPAHHSSPGRTFDVVISDPPRQLALWMARDSSDPREYWVFFPSPSKLAFRAALKTDIGHVKTSAFDGYGL